VLGEGLGDNLLEVVKQASRELQHTDDTLIKHVHELQDTEWVRDSSSKAVGTEQQWHSVK